MPARLGRYAVRRRIGAGAFATVWLAYDEQLDSPVAIKVLADNWTEDQAVRQRFLEEGRFLRRVESPYVVTVYDAGEIDDGRPYLVMSYADQGTLADRLEIDGLTPAQALEVVRQVGAGLQTLHERGVLHRDLKPANVLFRGVDGQVRAMVADLGLGKSMEVSSRLTVIAGTPSFVSPEQAQGEPLDPRSDLFSLAALTHLLLSGRAAFSHASLAAAAEPGPPPPLSTPGRAFSEEVSAVVARGLAADREDRWPDVASYVAALSAALTPALEGEDARPWLPLDPQLTHPGAAPSMLGDHVSLPDPDLPRRPRRRRRVVGVLAALLVVAGGAAIGYALGGREPAEATITDASGYLTVTVPSAWDGAVAGDGWQPRGADGDYPGLSVGTGDDWASSTEGRGVFVGILPGTELPDRVPNHPECDSEKSPIDGIANGGDALTVVFTGCEDRVVVERVVQLTDNRLLWVQVRSDSTTVANRVLDDVETHGFS
ncbi:serine/threonine-protein kinase [Nocardioides sp. YIM 152315]|uniref:serine/threonine-protein kinase n=1 Tax=Nocardioides sp. YIM 152315 TaxID=3031760 RepID=UPI0023D9E346|nr:serine/threonine-protein kinase [Nocardioides sp. YIM 152315]MDF1604263.1 serine/threonine-protein kinase [Nocardioides sp. YIM 152315]